MYSVTFNNTYDQTMRKLFNDISIEINRKIRTR